MVAIDSCILTESQLFETRFALKVLDSQPATLELQVKSIALSSIALHGLGGVKANMVRYFDSRSDVSDWFHAHATSNSNVLYIPTSWNCPRIDAVLVSHHVKKSRSKRTLEAASKSASLALSANASADSESPSTSAVSALPSLKPLKEVVDYIRVEFIRINTGTITDGDLAKTRSVLSAASPERELWRQVAGDSNRTVKFSLRWLVSEQEMKTIPPFVGVGKSAIKVSPLSSVNYMLVL